MRCAITGNIVAGTFPSVYKLSGNTLYIPLLGGSWPGVLTASIATLNPCGFSNLCTSTGPYNNFRVYGSKIKITFQAVGADSVTFTLTPLTAPTSSVPTGVADILAEPRTKRKMLTGGSKSMTLTSEMKVQELYGISKETIANDVIGVLSGTYNTSPTQTIAWYVCWTTSTGVATVGAIGYEVEVIYDAEFFNLNAGALKDD